MQQDVKCPENSFLKAHHITIRRECIVGVYEQERKKVQELIFELVINLNAPLSAETIKEIFLALVIETGEKKFKLLERIAYEISKGLHLKLPLSTSFALVIKKPAAIKNASYCYLKLCSGPMALCP